jgi:hypothetical protein
MLTRELGHCLDRNHSLSHRHHISSAQNLAEETFESEIRPDAGSQAKMGSMDSTRSHAQGQLQRAAPGQPFCAHSASEEREPEREG